MSFEPTIETFADEAEWNRYRFSEEEEKEVLLGLSVGDPEKWKRSFHAPVSTTPACELPMPPVVLDYAQAPIIPASELYTPPAASDSTPATYEPQRDKSLGLHQRTLSKDRCPYLKTFNPQPPKKSWQRLI